MKNTRSPIQDRLVLLGLVLTVGSALSACVPNVVEPIDVPTETLAIGCGSSSPVSMTCVSDTGEALGKFSLGLDVTCGSDKTISAISVTSDLRGSDLQCSLVASPFERSSTVLNEIIAVGGDFTEDADLKALPIGKVIEWKCTENYSEDLTRDLSHFYHFITFKKSGSVILGKIENRNNYIDGNGVSNVGSSHCTFELPAPAAAVQSSQAVQQ